MIIEKREAGVCPDYVLTHKGEPKVVYYPDANGSAELHLLINGWCTVFLSSKPANTFCEMFQEMYYAFDKESNEDNEPKETFVPESFALKMLAVASGNVNKIEL